MPSSLFSDLYGRPEKRAISVPEHNKALRTEAARELSGVDEPYTVRFSMLSEIVGEARNQLEDEDLSDSEREAWQRVYDENKRRLDAMPRAESEAERAILRLKWRTR